MKTIRDMTCGLGRGIQRAWARAATLVVAAGALAQAPATAQGVPGDREPGPVLPGIVESPELALQLDYPTLEVAENRAYIPLFFTVRAAGLAALGLTNDITVRAKYVGGTAKPGEDFDVAEPVRVVPVLGGLNSLSWVQLPLVQDEENEGTETATFELSIDGSTNAPVQMQVAILDDQEVGEVGFVSPRFQINEGATNGWVELRLWRTLNTRKAATVTYRVEGSPAAMAILGGETQRTITFQPGDSQVFARLPLVNNTDAQGTQDLTLTLVSSDDGMKLMKGYETTVLTIGDDETLPPPVQLSIREYDNGSADRGVHLSAEVPRGYQVRVEHSDNGTEGPWQMTWILEGADTERTAFNSFAASAMRMFRALPPEPLSYTYPW
jgi:hypothetical protein